MLLWSVPGLCAPSFQGIYAIAGNLLDQAVEPPARTPAGGARARPEIKPKGRYALDFEALRAAQARGVFFQDPVSRCLPQGMPRFWTAGAYAFEILQTPSQINLYQEWNEQTRRVYLDGRGHPVDADPTSNGHSVGHWEGEVLVIDTVNIATDALMTSQGLKHSEKLHIVERLRRVSPTQLELAMTVEDPEALVEPWSQIFLLNQKRTLDIREYVCAENNKDS